MGTNSGPAGITVVDRQPPDERVMRQPFPRTAFLPLLALISLAGACTGISDGAPPSQARIVVEASPENPLRLIVSTDFVMVTDEVDGGTYAAFRSADTVAISGDYEATYSLSVDEPRLTALLGNYYDPVELGRLRIFLDGEEVYDIQANLANGGFLQYIYRYSEPTIGS